MSYQVLCRTFVNEVHYLFKQSYLYLCYEILEFSFIKGFKIKLKKKKSISVENLVWFFNAMRNIKGITLKAREIDMLNADNNSNFNSVSTYYLNPLRGVFH